MIKKIVLPGNKVKGTSNEKENKRKSGKDNNQKQERRGRPKK
jgi:hypothetical protein